jgi:hypothetical protein
VEALEDAKVLVTVALTARGYMIERVPVRVPVGVKVTLIITAVLPNAAVSRHRTKSLARFGVT